MNSLKITLMPDGGGPGEDRAAGRDIIRRTCSLPGQEKMEGSDRLQRCCMEELGEIVWEWGREESKMTPRFLSELLGSTLPNLSLSRFGN